MNTVQNSSYQFEVGMAWLEKSDVSYFYAPIKVEQHLNPNLLTVVWLFAHVSSTVNRI